MPAWGELTLDAWEEHCQPGTECLHCLCSFPGWGLALPTREEVLPSWKELTLDVWGGSTASLVLSNYSACIPSWLGTSAANLGRDVIFLGRADCLGESASSLGLSTCAACIHPLLGGSAAYLGRALNCLGNSTVCLAMSPWLGTSAVDLRGVASPDCLRRSTTCLGGMQPVWEELLTAWETSAVCLTIRSPAGNQHCLLGRNCLLRGYKP